MRRMTSLLRVEERLLEADYFARRLGRLRGEPWGYELNAFLSAARSVSFLMQKELAHVDGFAEWWELQRVQLRADRAARFFLELRNFSQKQGRVSVVGSGGRSGRRLHWTYCFAGNSEPVPPELRGRDVAHCCREHVAKLASLVLRCMEAFPHHCCPALALTPAGVDALELSLEDVEEALGFPRGFTDLGPASREDRIRLLQRHVDGVDRTAIDRMARWRPPSRARPFGPSGRLGQALTESLISRLESKAGDDGPRPARGDDTVGT